MIFIGVGVLGVDVDSRPLKMKEGSHLVKMGTEVWIEIVMVFCAHGFALDCWTVVSEPPLTSGCMM